MPAVILGYVILFFGVLALLASGSWVALVFSFVLLTLGGFLALTRTKTVIDTDKHRIKMVTSLFFVPTGKWVEMQKYPEISVLKSRRGFRAYGGRSNQSTANVQTYFDVMLLSSNHRKKLVLATHDGYEKALEEAHKLAGQLGKPVVKFAPKISKQTQQRRR